MVILFRKRWAQGDPYLEAVNLSFIFTWYDGETEDRAKVFTSTLFERLWINNFESPKSDKNKMHDNTDIT